MEKKKRFFFGLVGVIALLILAATNVVYQLAFNTLRESLDSQLGEQLEGQANAIAEVLRSYPIESLFGDDFDAATYLRIHDLLGTLATGNGLASVTVLDTLWNDPFTEEPDTLSRIVYSLLDQNGQWAVMSGLSWTSPTFQWGESYYRSAAAPIVDTLTGQTVAIVRVEADAGYFGVLSKLETLAWWIHASSAILALMLMALFAWYIRWSQHWESRLMHSEKLIGLGRLAATIAHEIKNPLGIIKAAAQRLDRVREEDKRRELLRFIPEEVDRLNRILTRYLRVASPTISRPVPVDIDSRLPQWMENSFPGTNEGGERWRLTSHPTGPVMANPDTPRQVLINLVNNALDATPADRVVTIDWRPADAKWGQLTVADRGPGIPRKTRQRIFEPFYTTKAKGSGLGLYAVKMMVEQDGGTVTIEENPGGGARFVIRWPLATTDHSHRTGDTNHGTDTDC